MAQNQEAPKAKRHKFNYTKILKPAKLETT